MKALLHLQWSMHKSMLRLCLVGIGIVAFFFLDSASEMSLVTFGLVFSANSIDVSKRILTGNNGQLLLYSMPITRQAIIKSLYVVNFLICTFVFLLVLPLQIYSGLLNDNLHTYLLTLTGLYGGSLVGIAFHMSFQLKNIDNNSTLELFLSFIGGIILIFIPHMGISFIPHEPSFWLRLFLMPIISVILYVYLTQRGIKKFSDRELL